MARNDPDAAPHCPRCDYNLYGLPDLRCPECGYEVSSAEDLEQARLLANRNAADRQVILAERIGGILGGVLWLLGTVFAVWATLRHKGPLAITSRGNFRILGYGLIGSLVVFFSKKYLGESLDRTLLVIGILWFVVGFAIWYMA